MTSSTKNFAFRYDEATRAAIEAHLIEERMTHKMAADVIGLSSATRLTKYLGLRNPNTVPESDMPIVENAIKNYLRHQARRKAMLGKLFENSVSRTIDSTIRLIRQTGDMGFIHGPAGSGKTCGGMYYQANNPNVIFLVATKGQSSYVAMKSMMFEELKYARDSKGRVWERGINKGEWIYDILRGSERVIIIDNAQRLTLGALEWWADLNDETNTPIVFMGNPDALDVMRKSDQISSRIGIVTDVDIKKDGVEIAEKLVQQFAPEGNGTLVEAIKDKMHEPGRARRARKFLRLAERIHAGLDGEAKTWERAAELAEAKLLAPNYQAVKR